jgi:hypothetical protein
VKVSIAFERASHVNSGTSVESAELPWPETEGRVMRHPLLHLESDPRGEITHYGGLVLAQQFVRRFGVAKRLDESLGLFKRHAPYHESDHVLAAGLYVVRRRDVFGGPGGVARERGGTALGGSVSNSRPDDGGGFSASV